MRNFRILAQQFTTMSVTALATLAALITLTATPAMAQTPGDPPVAAQLARGEQSISLGQRADIKVPKLICGAEAGSKALWLDGMDSGIRAIGCDEKSELLVFNISQHGAGESANTAAVWLTLIRNPFQTKSRFLRDVNFSIVESGKVLATGQTKLALIGSMELVVSAVILVFVIAMLGFGAFKSGLLRDSGLPADGVASHRSFSLARVQMVWWFTIVFTSYILLWLLMKELPAIPASALGLIGMAGGTALIACAIDKDRPTQKTQGFWIDITTDADGVTLPRLQQIAWTLLLGFIFLAQVAAKLTMPDFDASVLALMGISGGLYLGFKVPESHVKSDPQQAGGAPGGTPDSPRNDGKTGYGQTS